MNQRSTQFRSREERQREERLQEKHSKIAMPAVCAAHAVRKRPEQNKHGSSLAMVKQHVR